MKIEKIEIVLFLYMLRLFFYIVADRGVHGDATKKIQQSIQKKICEMKIELMNTDKTSTIVIVN